MKIALWLIAAIMMGATLSGCAAGSATAGYSLRAGTSDDLSSKSRQAIVDEAVDKAYSKTKAYVDENFVKKEGK